MNSNIRSGRIFTAERITVGVIIFVLLVCKSALGYSEEMLRSFVEGPWELAAQVGREGAEHRFPITVHDPNKPEKLDRSLPGLRQLIRQIHTGCCTN